MLKYARIINEETGLCEVGLGTDAQYYVKQGLIELDVEQSDVDNNWYLIEKCPHLTPKEKERRRKEQVALLSLTKREVFLALYRADGTTPDSLRARISDPEALIEFDYAEKYYRGNPLINQIGALLGYTPEDLDYLFINKELPSKTPEPTEEPSEEEPTESEEPTGEEE